MGRWTYRPILLCRRSESAENDLQLVHVRFSGKVGRPEHQLGEDAPDGPHIDSSRVVTRAEKDLGCPVPKRDDLISIHPYHASVNEPEK